MLTLDVSSGIQLEYLAEGAANVVYRIVAPSPSPNADSDAGFEDYEHLPSEIAPPRMDPELEGKLVRLRKATPSGVTVYESYKHYETNIIPLFANREDLVEYILFRPTRSLLHVLNSQLKAMERHAIKQRPKKRHGTYLAEEEEYGLLITDMSPSSTPASVTYRCFEFKPKWLAQSPSAPMGAVRCRTCALRHLRRYQRSHGASGTEEARPEYCPLGLISSETAIVERTVERLSELDPVTKILSPEDELVGRRLIEYVCGNPLLGRLRELQRDWDPAGVLNSTSPSSLQALSVAMTLRDCTLFLKVGKYSCLGWNPIIDNCFGQVPLNESGEVEARLGDLDFKCPDLGKREYWQSIEIQLRDKGWYMGREEGDSEADRICILWKDHSTELTD